MSVSWTDQNPPATDVLLCGRAVTKSGEQITFAIDRIPPPEARAWAMYRATVGDLFGSQEICRNRDLEKTLRWLTIDLERR